MDMMHYHYVPFLYVFWVAAPSQFALNIFSLSKGKLNEPAACHKFWLFFRAYGDLQVFMRGRLP